MTQTLRIGSHRLGEGQKTFIIGEIGSNHDRNWDQACRLIDVVADSGADAVKIQLFDAGVLYAKNSPTFKLLRDIEFPREWVPKLAAYSQQRGLIFLASPFDVPAVDCLVQAKSLAYKVASSEVVNLPLLRHIAQKNKPILLSTGMCDLADIHDALETIYAAGNREVVLLQCTSLYPTEARHVHLRVMDTLRSAFHVPVGFSDHTLSPYLPAAAVARGACVIEKHLTLSRSLQGPDHSYALEPQEFQKMVQAVRDVEQALGSYEKALLPEEAVYARREGIWAAHPISKGATLRASHFVIKRPAKGLRARFLTSLMGQRAKKAFRKGDPITGEIL